MVCRHTIVISLLIPTQIIKGERDYNKGELNYECNIIT